MTINKIRTQSGSSHKPRRDAHPRSGDAQFAPIVILAWFILQYKIDHQEMFSLGLDLLSTSF